MIRGVCSTLAGWILENGLRADKHQPPKQNYRVLEERPVKPLEHLRKKASVCAQNHPKAVFKAPLLYDYKTDHRIPQAPVIFKFFDGISLKNKMVRRGRHTSNAKSSHRFGKTTAAQHFFENRAGPSVPEEPVVQLTRQI